jgi:signal transduction histidine kinase
MPGIPAEGDGTFATRGVIRVMSVTLQIAALILLVLNLPDVLEQSPRFPHWWTVAAAIAVAVPAIACVAIAGFVRPRALQLVCGLQAIAVLVVLVAVPVALGGGRLDPSLGMPWPVRLAVVAGAASAVAWGGRGALAYGIALQATTFALVFVSAGDPIPGLAFGDSVFGLFYVTLFTSLALALGRAGAVLDRTAASAVADARAVATAEAGRAARRRVATLIHDSVIVALLAYSREPHAGRAVEEADRALDAIAALHRVDEPRERTPMEFVWELQALTTELDSEASFDYETAAAPPVPAELADAIVEATSEALRNSVRHAPVDVPVTREVRVVVAATRVEVLVLDDGDGFDPSTVPPTRLGIRSGIVARMGRVGGTARIDSRLGYGTIVLLAWERP